MRGRHYLKAETDAADVEVKEVPYLRPAANGSCTLAVEQYELEQQP